MGFSVVPPGTIVGREYQGGVAGSFSMLSRRAWPDANDNGRDFIYIVVSVCCFLHRIRVSDTHKSGLQQLRHLRERCPESMQR